MDRPVPGVRPTNIPSSPNETYKHDGWQGYGHWLGTGNVGGGNGQGQKFLPFKQALVYARSLKLTAKTEWTGVKPANMPSSPHSTYTHEGWQGYGHWLGAGHQRGGSGQQILLFK